MRTIYKIKNQNDESIFISFSKMMDWQKGKILHIQVMNVNERGYNLSPMADDGSTFVGKTNIGIYYNNFDEAIAAIKSGYYGEFLEERMV